MPRIPVRPLLGLALALCLAAVAAPAEGSRPGDEDQVRTASVAPPLVFSLVDEVVTPPSPGQVLSGAAQHVTREVAASPPPPEPVAEPNPPATPPPPRAPAGSVQEIIQRHFGAAAGQAIRIADCESDLDPGAISATDDHGLFQINAPSHRGQFEAVTGHPWSAVYDPEVNTAYAKWLHDQQGWGPWACRRVL